MNAELHLLRQNADCELDTRGLSCPLPVLRAGKALRELKQGALLCVLADDPVARLDFPHFCHQSGHILLASYSEDHSYFVFLIQCGEGSAQVGV